MSNIRRSAKNLLYVSDNIKTIPLCDVDNTVITFADWVPQEFQEHAQRQLEALKSHKYKFESNDGTLFYRLFITSIKSIQPAFNDVTLKRHWINLNKISPRSSFLFAILLSDLHNDYARLGGNILLRQEEVQAYKKLLAKSHELLLMIEDVDSTYVNHRFIESNQLLIDNLSSFIGYTDETLADYAQAYVNYSNNVRLNRQFKHPNAVALFSIRSIHVFFIEHFGKPMHDCVADFVNAIFGTTYTDNDIIKAVQNKKTSARVKTRRGK